MHVQSAPMSRTACPEKVPHPKRQASHHHTRVVTLERPVCRHTLRQRQLGMVPAATHMYKA